MLNGDNFEWGMVENVSIATLSELFKNTQAFFNFVTRLASFSKNKLTQNVHRKTLKSGNFEQVQYKVYLVFRWTVGNTYQILYFEYVMKMISDQRSVFCYSGTRRPNKFPKLTLNNEMCPFIFGFSARPHLYISVWAYTFQFFKLLCPVDSEGHSAVKRERTLVICLNIGFFQQRYLPVSVLWLE